MPVTFPCNEVYVEEARSDTLRSARLAFAPHSHRRRSRRYILAASRRTRFASPHGKAGRDHRHRTRSVTLTKAGGPTQRRRLGTGGM